MSTDHESNRSDHERMLNSMAYSGIVYNHTLPQETRLLFYFHLHLCLSFLSSLKLLERQVHDSIIITVLIKRFHIVITMRFCASHIGNIRNLSNLNIWRRIIIKSRIIKIIIKSRIIKIIACLIMIVFMHCFILHTYQMCLSLTESSLPLALLMLLHLPVQDVTCKGC